MFIINFLSTPLNTEKLSWEQALCLHWNYSFSLPQFLFPYLNALSQIGSVSVKKQKKKRKENETSETSIITPSVNYHRISHRQGRAAILLQPKGGRGMLLQTTHTSSPHISHCPCLHTVITKDLQLRLPTDHKQILLTAKLYFAVMSKIQMNDIYLIR